jgi:ethanolamine utilization protein EutM
MAKALGLIETRGLVAAIEAADAMVKAANVTLIGKERTDPALITVKVVGETAAVRSAVDAGAAAAKRVGQLVSTHIIPQPDSQMVFLIPEIEDKKKTSKEKPESVEIKKSETTVTETKSSIPETLFPPGKQEIEKVKVETKKEKKAIREEEESTSASDTISRLRREALGIKEEKKEEEKPAQPPKGKLSMKELEILNVHQLRRFARSTDGFPIQGRQISKANRKELLDYFKKLI